jgi:hypothetical protein
MLLNEQESRVAVAALQTLERKLAEEIEQFAEPAAHGLPQTLRNAFDRHEIIANLTKKLATAGNHEVDAREIELTIRGLDRYVDLLNQSVDEHDIEDEDFLLSPERKSRQQELARGGMLLDKLGESRRANASPR